MLERKKDSLPSAVVSSALASFHLTSPHLTSNLTSFSTVFSLLLAFLLFRRIVPTTTYSATPQATSNTRTATKYTELSSYNFTACDEYQADCLPRRASRHHLRHQFGTDRLLHTSTSTTANTYSSQWWKRNFFCFLLRQRLRARNCAYQLLEHARQRQY